MESFVEFNTVQIKTSLDSADDLVALPLEEALQVYKRKAEAEPYVGLARDVMGPFFCMSPFW